jgi:hypothetical protein
MADRRTPEKWLTISPQDHVNSTFERPSVDHVDHLVAAGSPAASTNK